MPFTPSHVVAILPLTSGRRSRPFDTAALTIGAMVPDLPYFVWPHAGAGWTHAWFGPVTIDLALGFVVLGVWRLAKPAVVELSPEWLRSRAPTQRAASLRAVVLSLVVGALTHVVWDSFSHPRRWGTEHIDWLTEAHGALPGYKWVQYGSGVVGLLVLGVWLVHRLARTPPALLPPMSQVQVRRRLGVWIAVGVALAIVTTTTWARGRAESGVWLDERTAVALATRSISCALVVLVVLAAGSGLVWWDGLRHGRRPAQDRTRPDAPPPRASGGHRRDGRP